jgi:hypothetical protein
MPLPSRTPAFQPFTQNIETAIVRLSSVVARRPVCRVGSAQL